MDLLSENDSPKSDATIPITCNEAPIKHEIMNPCISIGLSHHNMIDNRFVIKVSVGVKSMKALLDSGSVCSMVSASWLVRNGIKYDLDNDSCELLGFGNVDNRIDIIGKVKLEITLQGLKLSPICAKVVNSNFF